MKRKKKRKRLMAWIRCFTLNFTRNNQSLCKTKKKKGKKERGITSLGSYETLMFGTQKGYLDSFVDI